MSNGRTWPTGQTRDLPDNKNLGGGVKSKGLRFSACDAIADRNLFCHELFHQLGFGTHLYGPAGAVNLGASFFALHFPTDPASVIATLDAPHRMRAGWMRPRVIRMDQTGGAARIGMTAGVADLDGQPPLLFYDPVRGHNEFFMVEYRNPNESRGFDTAPGMVDRLDVITTPGTPRRGSDGMIDLGQGVAVWYVRVDETGEKLASLAWPPQSGTGDLDGAYLVSPQSLRAPFPVPGTGPLWQNGDGELQLRWYDGTPSGLMLRVGPMDASSRSVVVQWRHRSLPHRPRIDCVVGNPSTLPRWFALSGLVGLRDDTAPSPVVPVPVLWDSRGRKHKLEIAGWTHTTPILGVPVEAASGPGRIVIYSDETCTNRSNAIFVNVANPYFDEIIGPFSTPNSSIPPLSGPDEDADRDGIPNLGEFLMGREVRVPDPTPPVQIRRDSNQGPNGGDMIRFTWKHLASRESYGRVVAQISPDLKKWEDLPALQSWQEGDTIWSSASLPREAQYFVRLTFRDSAPSPNLGNHSEGPNQGNPNQNPNWVPLRN